MVFLNDLENYFVIPKSEKPIFDNLIVSKLNSGKRINVYFSTNYSSPNYYFLSQLIDISKLSSFENVYFYISYADTVLSAKKHAYFSVQTAELDEKFLHHNINQVRTILSTAGVKEDNIFLFTASDAWAKFLTFDPKQSIEFYNALSLYPDHISNIPTDITTRYYISKETRYSFAYVLQKTMDLFVATYFHKLFPEEIEGKIDILVLSNSTAPVSLKAKKIFSKNSVLSNLPTLITLRDVPCFGHNSKVNKKFLVPHWDMSVEEIYKVIDEYKVSKEHIKLLFETILNELEEYLTLSKSGKVTSSKNKPELEKNSHKNQKIILAHNLNAFLRNIKRTTSQPTPKTYLIISKKDQITKVAKFLRSETYLKLLELCNGENSITDLSKRLNKHISNVSAAISELKQEGLVLMNEEKKPVRVVNTIKVDFQ